jgi:hypothetical protein
MKPSLFADKTARGLASRIGKVAGWTRAYVPLKLPGGWLLAGRRGAQRTLAVGFQPKPPKWAAGLAALPKSEHPLKEFVVWSFDAGHDVLKTLRLALPFLSPALSGAKASVGFGDRTGLATPGHLRSLEGTPLFPVIAQQSIREMTRTGRTPDDVMDDAVFGALQAGWTSGFGADADHLKTAEDIGRTAAAGFVLFTLDVGDHIGKGVGAMSDADLTAAASQNADFAKWKAAYLGKIFKFPGFTVAFTERILLETVVKYGRAVQKAAELAAAAKAARGSAPCEIEMSVDETNEDTTEADHVFVARELKARGVKLAAIAPKFIGSFEKGIEYKGDRAAFEASLRRHAAIAKATGGHKISVHSGSDKFSLYPAVARECKGRFHLKTAGTSWLEALRAVCRTDPALFREAADLARARYETDRASYHISGRVEDVPAPGSLPDGELEAAYFDTVAGRQILHVTYGSVFQSPLKARVFEVLNREEEAHADCVSAHLRKHVAPLAGKKVKAPKPSPARA